MEFLSTDGSESTNVDQETFFLFLFQTHSGRRRHYRIAIYIKMLWSFHQNNQLKLLFEDVSSAVRPKTFLLGRWVATAYRFWCRLRLQQRRSATYGNYRVCSLPQVVESAMFCSLDKNPINVTDEYVSWANMKGDQIKQAPKSLWSEVMSIFFFHIL